MNPRKETNYSADMSMRGHILVILVFFSSDSKEKLSHKSLVISVYDYR